MPYKFNVFTATLDYYSAGDTAVAVAGVKADIEPTPTADNSTTEFTVPDAYVTGSLTVYLNGLAETNISETSDTTFEFDEAPHTGDTIRVSYEVVI